MSNEWTVENLDLIQSHWLLTGQCLLSPYPKTYRENLEWRAEILRKAKEDLEFRAKVRELFYKDPLFAFNAFFYTLDVRRSPRHHRPFTTFPYQDLIILTKADHIIRGEDLIEEKSRDMGASWTTIGVYVWLWLNPAGGFDFLLGSRKEDYVDKKGDMRTLFEKARYLVKRLPFWLLPVGWSPKRDDNYMKLVNPETGSSITGESNNANFGTGGRYKAIFPDEFAKWKDTDMAAWTSMADATPCRMPASTPFGAFGQYFNIITDGKTKKLTIHWSLHPTKGYGAYCVYPRPKDLPKEGQIDWLHWKGARAWLRSPWYDAEERRRSSKSEIAQELDIDYIGSGSPVFTGPAAGRMMELLRSRKKPIAIYDISHEAKMEPIELEDVADFEDKLIVFSEPTEYTQEVIGVDVVEGKEHGDFAVIKGMDRATRSLSFTYFSRVDEALLADVIEAINNWLCSTKSDPSMEPYIAIETNGPGLATFDLCYKKDMYNLFMTPNFDTAKEQTVYQKGWRTTSTSRKVLVAAIKSWLIESLGWVDERCVKEMTGFAYKSPNRPEAAAGTNDDEVIAWGICLAVDDLLPLMAFVPKKTKKGSVQENVFSLEDLKIEESSLEEKCIQTIEKRKREIGNESPQIYVS